MMSVIQWTPLISLPMTINPVNTAITTAAVVRSHRLLMRRCSCIMAVGITHITSMVVEDG